MAQFATGADMLIYYDRRRLSELVSDTGSPVPPEQVAANAVLAAMLVAASDEILAAAGVGKKYTESDLNTLSSASTGGGPLLRMLTCHLAWGQLVNRRALAATDQQSLTPMWKWCQEYLTLVRNGERVFGGVPDVLDAGLPTTKEMAPTPGLQRPSIVQGASRVFGTGPVVDRPYGW